MFGRLSLLTNETSALSLNSLQNMQLSRAHTVLQVSKNAELTLKLKTVGI
jgi:hypothetical protein